MCASGRIHGAYRLGGKRGPWIIPAGEAARFVAEYEPYDTLRKCKTPRDTA
jgi:hypothetical protein